MIHFSRSVVKLKFKTCLLLQSAKVQIDLFVLSTSLFPAPLDHIWHTNDGMNAVVG